MDTVRSIGHYHVMQMAHNMREREAERPEEPERAAAERQQRPEGETRLQQYH